MNICQWPAGKVQRRMFSLHWKWILLKLFNMRICTAHTRNSIPRVHPPQCSPWRVRFLKLYSWIFISSCPFCLGRIITIKHKGIRFPLFFFLTPIIETQTPTWRQLEGQIIEHSLIDAFKLSSCQVSSVSISSQSLQGLTFNKCAKRDVDSCSPV